MFTVPRNPAAFPQSTFPPSHRTGPAWSFSVQTTAEDLCSGAVRSTLSRFTRLRELRSPVAHHIHSGRRMDASSRSSRADSSRRSLQTVARRKRSRPLRTRRVVVGAPMERSFQPQIGPLYRFSAAGGPATPLRELNSSRGELRQVWPHFLPDGKHYLYGARSSDAEKTGIYLGTVGTEESRLLIRGESNIVYSPPGYLLFVRDGTLVAQAFDLGTLQLSGGAFPLPSYGGESFPALGRRSDCFPFRRMAFWCTPVAIWSTPSRLVRPARQGGRYDRRARRIWHRQVVVGRQACGSGSVLVREPECGCWTSQPASR